MADLEEIERLYNVETDNKKLRDGKKKPGKNQYYYFKNKFFLMKVQSDKWYLLPDTPKAMKLMRSHTWYCGSGGYLATHTNNTTKFWHQIYLDYRHPNVADHKNKRRFDNRAENLKITTYGGAGGNNRNKTKPRNNTSGKQGVHRTTKGDRQYWKVEIIDNDGKKISKCFSIDKLGEEDAKHEAIQKRIELERLYGYDGIE